jgi:hypothetical protein
MAMTAPKWIASLSVSVVVGYVLIRLLGAGTASLVMLVAGMAGMWWDRRVRENMSPSTLPSGRLSRSEVADIIEAFLAGTGGDWDWDDFISFPLADPELDSIRIRCDRLPADFPPTALGQYTNDAGLDVLRKYVTDLRGTSGTPPC